MRLNCKALVIAAISVLFLKISPANSGSNKCYGLFIDNDVSKAAIEERAILYGQKPCAVMLFWSWDDYPFNTNLLKNIWNAGAIPLITLEPWYAKSKRGVPLKDISSGKQDRILIEFGKVIKDFNHPVMVRFAHEMNGNWYPWSGERYGRSGKDYIEAYRHAFKIITESAGGVPLFWVWSINVDSVPKEPWNEVSNYYPGDKYVTAIGLDGYHWEDQREGNARYFDDIFGGIYDKVRTLYPSKPVIISEIAASERIADRDEWIVDFFRKARKKYNSIPLFVWFDIKKEMDWRILADKASFKSFKRGVKTGFGGSRSALLELLKGK